MNSDSYKTIIILKTSLTHITLSHKFPNTHFLVNTYTKRDPFINFISSSSSGTQNMYLMTPAASTALSLAPDTLKM